MARSRWPMRDPVQKTRSERVTRLHRSTIAAGNSDRSPSRSDAAVVHRRPSRSSAAPRRNVEEQPAATTAPLACFRRIKRVTVAASARAGSSLACDGDRHCTSGIAITSASSAMARSPSTATALPNAERGPRFVALTRWRRSCTPPRRRATSAPAESVSHSKAIAESTTPSKRITATVQEFALPLRTWRRPKTVL